MYKTLQKLKGYMCSLAIPFQNILWMEPRRQHRIVGKYTSLGSVSVFASYLTLSNLFNFVTPLFIQLHNESNVSFKESLQRLNQFTM